MQTTVYALCFILAFSFCLPDCSSQHERTHRIRRRIGQDPHANGAQTVGCRGCPDIWELESGGFAVIGIDITDTAKAKLPPTAGCGPDERIVSFSQSARGSEVGYSECLVR